MPLVRFSMPLGCSLALLLVGCNKSASNGGAGPSPANGGPVVVHVASPKKQSLRWTIEQPATVEPYEVTPVVAKLPGYIASIAPDPRAARRGAVIDIGSEVTAGQLLATMRIPELVAEAAEKRAAVKQAEAELAQSQKEREVADALVEGGKAMLAEARAGLTKADTEVKRWVTELAQARQLVQGTVIDAQSKDVVEKQHDAAKAAKNEAEARVNTAAAVLTERQARRAKVNADIASSETRVEVAKAAVKRLEALLGYLEVKAPFAGIVIGRNIHTEHFLQPAAGNSAQVLFTVARLDIVRIFADIPEAVAVKAGTGSKAIVRVPAFGNHEFPGEVTRTTGVVNPGTRTLRVEIDLDNPDRKLKPGMYATVSIPAEAADAMVLPSACVLAADETNYVYLVESGKVVKYRVETGRTDGMTIQVLACRKAIATTGNWEPFTGSERVVVGGLGALLDGLGVEVAE